ncbi:MAG: hypothetical protein B7C24_10515 [Bacteroidetes bacterium 4572_77]|nr:MAG: hypothetical protein B7C24_10515 [Bacteroidetes bacterium 4572_77]
MLRNSQLVLKSNLSELHKLEAFVEQISDMYNVNSNYYSNILVALSEGVSNAIVHAHSENEELLVQVRFEAKHKGLFFSITDSGSGFDFDNYPDPTDINISDYENIGTGLYLMKSLSDVISYDADKRTVEIGFKISSINKELAVLRATSLAAYFETNKIDIKAQ